MAVHERICLVTGAGRGMGRAIALELARQGAGSVVALDVDEQGAEETADQVRALGAAALAVRCDLRDREQISAAVSRTVTEYGGLDVLVNNAGVLERAFTNDVDFDVVPEELWDLVMDVNLKAVWLMSRFAAPHLRRSDRSPTIINAASVAGKTAFSHAAYGVSKAAVIHLTRSMAVTLAPEVRVNCYCPGTILTDMSSRTSAAGTVDPRVATMTGPNLIPRMGTVDEVAALVAFLASPEAGFITGAAYDIDGGALAWRGSRNAVG